MSGAPLVSIVVATYNSSHLLRYAIRSVLDSTLTDWEMVIVGDACTDETAAVVRSFGDSRLMFSNLIENSGDQAVPNNHGLTSARGRYVAFLNQDDLYFPDHLQRSIDALERSGADLVWGPCAAIQPATEAALARDEWTAELLGVPPAPTYSPCAFYCASSWVMRRELSARVGPWRTVDELWVTPSQDWLFGAWRSGATLRFRDHVSVLVIASGATATSIGRRTNMRTSPRKWVTRRSASACSSRPRFGPRSRICTGCFSGRWPASCEVWRIRSMRC